MKKLKPLLLVGIVVLFVGYWIMNDPAAAARVTRDAARTTWDVITALFNGLIDFLDALFR